MNADLYHLVYQSTATTALGEAELRTILTQSRAWNTQHELTGLLLYCEGSIIQVLEGPEAEVRYIFTRISKDFRHVHLMKLSDGYIQQRSFNQWSMGFKVVNSEEFSYLKGYVAPNHSGSLTHSVKNQDVGLHAVLTAFVAADRMHI